ncbi:MAG: hypothetical protein WAT46_13815, partial [Saprospiraceae bacterium]
MILRYPILLFFISINVVLYAQSPYMLRGDQAYHTYDRMEILKLSDTTLVNSINNYDRKSLIQFLYLLPDQMQF